MKTYTLILCAFLGSLSSQAGMIDCEYTVTYFPELGSETTEIETEGKIQLDLTSLKLAIIPLVGAASKTQYHLIGRAFQMMNGTQIHFGLFSGVKFEGLGYTGFPIANSMTTFSEGQKQTSQMIQAPFTILSLNCKL